MKTRLGPTLVWVLFIILLTTFTAVKTHGAPSPVAASTSGADHPPVSAASVVDACEANLGRDYHLKLPFDGQDLLVALKKRGLKGNGHLMVAIFDNSSHADRVELTWSTHDRQFKVKRTMGMRIFPSFVKGEGEIRRLYSDMQIALRQLSFDIALGSSLASRPGTAKGGPALAAPALVVTDNGEKITRLVAPKFSCEFLDFFSCSCL